MRCPPEPAQVMVSGSSGEPFLSPNFIFDALALDPA
jgi:hypothetical protein